MFQLTSEEFVSLRSQVVSLNLKSQIAISSSDWGGRRHPPFAFTEHGVAMLSSVLRSKRAVQVNIEIMRAFVRLFLNSVNDLNGANPSTMLRARPEFYRRNERKIGPVMVSLSNH